MHHLSGSFTEVNAQTEDGGIAIVNAVSGDFGMHRRLLLAVAMKMTDRGEGENFTADNAAGGEVGRIAADDEAGGAVEVDEVNENRYLTKISWTAFSILAFNSSSCCFENPEVMMLRFLLT